MIFKNSTQTNQVEHCCLYHPYRVLDVTTGKKIKNPKFDPMSGLILDLKEGNASALKFFAEYLEKLVSAEIAICYVPSHDPEKTESGIRKLARRLAANGRVDATECLVRKIEIDKLSSGGNRSINNHLKSIQVVNANLIKGKEVLLLDDVSSTGNSLKACRGLLLNAGASFVQMLAIARTSQD